MTQTLVASLHVKIVALPRSRVAFLGRCRPPKSLPDPQLVSQPGVIAKSRSGKTPINRLERQHHLYFDRHTIAVPLKIVTIIDLRGRVLVGHSSPK